MPPVTSTKPYAKPVAAPINDALPISHQSESPPLYAYLSTSIPKPKARHTPAAISNVNPNLMYPFGLNRLIGSFPQYAYKFNPLILSESKYSIESGEINLPISES